MNERSLKNILVIAAENSAENYGAQVVEEFQKKNAGVHFFGVGGEKMASLGVELVIHNKELSVVGIIEVISSLLKLKRVMNRLFKEAIKRKVDGVLLIDYPDFNLRMAKRCKKAGLRVFYYISPTVWAWRYSRVQLIKKYVDHIFIIFPFEVPIFEREGINYTYTGHPLLPLIEVKQGREGFRQENGVAGNERVVTLLPGSRKSEIEFLLPRMLAAIDVLQQEFRLKVFLRKASGIDRHLVDGYLARCKVPVQVMDQERGYDMIHASDAVLTTCGTSNLEIAMLGVPFTAVYQVNRLSYFLGKRFVKINLYSIVNILAGKEVIKEWIQENFTVENLVREMRRLLTDEKVRQEMSEAFATIRAALVQKHHPPELVYNKIAGELGITVS